MGLFDTVIGALKTAAPLIATALGGPLAGSAVKFLAGKLGTEETPEAIEQAIAGMTPADMIRLKELDNQFKIEMAKNGIQIDLAQIGVNVEEAKSTRLFIAGWRPFVGWVCGFALLYAAIIEPITRFIARVAFRYEGDFPVVEIAVTLPVLLGMLGLGAMRTTEKVKGAEGNR